MNATEDKRKLNFTIALDGSIDKTSHLIPIEVNFSAPLSTFCTTISQVFKLTRKEEFIFRACDVGYEGKLFIGRKLNAQLSLNDQGVMAGTYIVLFPLERYQEETVASLSSKFTMEGWLTKSSKKGGGKATGNKKRWCLLKDGILFYFEKKQAAIKPSGFIDLEYMSTKYDKPKGEIKLEKMDSFVNEKREYTFVADTPEEAIPWMRHISKITFPGIKNVFFGISLSSIISRGLSCRGVPHLIIKAIAYLEQKGLGTEGIFRISGISGQIEDLKDSFDQGLDVDLMGVRDPNTVAGLLKLYLRELPEPILSSEKYDEFIRAAKDSSRIKALVESLPTPSQACLSVLLPLFKKVVDNKARNMMDINAISTVMAPNFLRPRQDTFGNMGETSTLTSVLITLIEIQSELNLQEPDVPSYLTFGGSKITNPTNTIVGNMAPPPSLSIPGGGSGNTQMTTPPKAFEIPNNNRPPSYNAYVTSKPPTSMDTPPQYVPPPPPPSTNSYAKANFDYNSTGAQNSAGEVDLSFKKGDVFEILEWRENWLLANINGVRGIVPANYVAETEAPIPEVNNNNYNTANNNNAMSLPPPSNEVAHKSFPGMGVGNVKRTGSNISTSSDDTSSSEEVRELRSQLGEAMRKLQLYESMYGPIEGNY